MPKRCRDIEIFTSDNPECCKSWSRTRRTDAWGCRAVAHSLRPFRPCRNGRRESPSSLTFDGNSFAEPLADLVENRGKKFCKHSDTLAKSTHTLTTVTTSPAASHFGVPYVRPVYYNIKKQSKKKIVYSSRFVRVILAQGPC